MRMAVEVDRVLHIVPGWEVREPLVRPGFGCPLVQLAGHGILAWRVRRLIFGAIIWHWGLSRALIPLAERLGRQGGSGSWVRWFPACPTGAGSYSSHTTPSPSPSRGAGDQLLWESTPASAATLYPRRSGRCHLVARPIHGATLLQFGRWLSGAGARVARHPARLPDAVAVPPSWKLFSATRSTAGLTGASRSGSTAPASSRPAASWTSTGQRQLP